MLDQVYCEGNYREPSSLCFRSKDFQVEAIIFPYRVYTKHLNLDLFMIAVRRIKGFPFNQTILQEHNARIWVPKISFYTPCNLNRCSITLQVSGIIYSTGNALHNDRHANLISFLVTHFWCLLFQTWISETSLLTIGKISLQKHHTST